MGLSERRNFSESNQVERACRRCRSSSLRPSCRLHRLMRRLPRSDARISDEWPASASSRSPSAAGRWRTCRAMPAWAATTARQRPLGRLDWGRGCRLLADGRVLGNFDPTSGIL